MALKALFQHGLVRVSNQWKCLFAPIRLKYVYEIEWDNFFFFFIFRWVLQIVTFQIRILWMKEKKIWNTSEQDDFRQHLHLTWLLFFHHSSTPWKTINSGYAKKKDVGPEACFSKVPELFGCISGGIILFVSLKRRLLEARHLVHIFIFISFTTCERTNFAE